MTGPTAMERRTLRLLADGREWTGRELALALRCAQSHVSNTVTLLCRAGLASRAGRIGLAKFRVRITALGQLANGEACLSCHVLGK
jgi:DNA-binding IclR family transcriptional regulator